MGAEDELALVLEALTCRESNSVKWKSAAVAQRIRKDPLLQGLTPEGIILLTRNFAREGGKVERREEKRSEYKEDDPWWYKAIVIVDGLPLPLFVEMCLFDDYPDAPEVIFVNAHLDR